MSKEKEQLKKRDKIEKEKRMKRKSEGRTQRIRWNDRKEIENWKGESLKWSY